MVLKYRHWVFSYLRVLGEMCYHTSQTKTTSKLEQRFKVKRNPKYEIGEDDFSFYHSNGFSHQNLLMIPQKNPKILTPAMWGIMPENIPGATFKAYYKDSIRYGSGLNARSEKLFDHFIYKHCALQRRCLVPVDGFFEPHEVQKKKFPVYIHRKNKESFALAGIYNVSKDGYVTFSVLTKNASPLFSDIHNAKKRQPVLLSVENERLWLQPDLGKADVEAVLNSTYDESELEAYSVDRALFSPKTDSNLPFILEPDTSAEFSKRFTA